MLLVGLLVAPLVVSAAQLLLAVGSSYRPPSDWALLEIHTRDAGSRLLTVGPYSRYGWNHPGPLLFYALYPAYRLFGSQSVGLHVGALAVNAAAIVGIGFVAFRRGRLPTSIAVLIPVALLEHALGIEILRDPWNPLLPVMPLLLLLLLAWSVAVGDLAMAPPAVVVASFTIQSHVGFAIVSVTLCAFALAVVVARGLRVEVAMRSAYWRRLARVALVCTAVGLVLWAPVLYGTLVRHDGNLAAIWRFFREPHATAGLGAALRVMGLQWGLRPAWIFGDPGSDWLGQVLMDDQWWLAVGLALGGAATFVAHRRGDRRVVWLAATIGVALLAALYALRGIVGALYPYLVRWTWALGAALGMLVLMGAWSAIRAGTRGRILLPITFVATGVLLVGSVMTSSAALGAGTPHPLDQASERAMITQVLAGLPAGRGPVWITGLAWEIPGLVNQLERNGVPVMVQPGQPVVFGTTRTPRGRYRAVLHVIGGNNVDEPAPAGRLIAKFERERTPGEQADLEAAIRSLRAQPRGAERDDLLEGFLRARDDPASRFEVYLERAR